MSITEKNADFRKGALLAVSMYKVPNNALMVKADCPPEVVANSRVIYGVLIHLKKGKSNS